MVRYLVSLLIFISIWCGSKVRGEVLINEVLVNEPGSITDLEWFELYNTSETDAVITFCQIRVTYAGSINDLPLLSGFVPAEGYAVICKDIGLFESYWGNGDGTWGNAPEENYNLYERPGFSLVNDSGTAILSCAGVSSLEWPDAGADGYSWERIHPDSETVLLSIDSLAATPGRPNSRLPQPFDLELVSVDAEPSGDGITSFTFRIANVGLDPVSEDSLFLFFDPEQDSVVSRSDLISVIAVPVIQSGDSTTITADISFQGAYAGLLAQLMSDDQNNNNLILLTAPGNDFPPVILNEFLPDPESPLATEWVELKNRTGTAQSLTDWYLGDSVSLHLISPDTLTIAPYEYLVLCRDSIGIIDFYGFGDFRPVELSSWPALNNNGDRLRLIDRFGFTADSISYDSGYGGNISWARGEISGFENRWGRSSDSGGTPGAENVVLFPSFGERIEVNIDPDPFSLSRAGITTISFSLPEGYMTMKLFDKRGREVLTLFDNFVSFEGAVAWDGTDKKGQPLPVGIYILYIEVAGYGSVKETVVIAP